MRAVLDGLLLCHLDQKFGFFRLWENIMASKADESGSSSNDVSHEENKNSGLYVLDLNQFLIEPCTPIFWFSDNMDQLGDEISPDDVDMVTDSEKRDEQTAAEPQDKPGCDDYNMGCEDNCPTRRPLGNRKVTKGDHPADHAKLTLPKFLSLSKSSIPEVGLGVWTQRDLPKEIVFGPYGGEKVYDFEKAHRSGYAWLVTKNGQPHYYIDAQDPSKSNWLRYINCATNGRLKNLMAFQYKGDIYYRTCKPVKKHTELLVWYGDEYSQETGIELEADDVDEENEKIPQFHCKKCGLIFSAEKYLNAHLRKHGDETGLHRHKCNFCLYSTDRATDLQRHLLTHTGEKPHECDQCGKRFAQRGYLQCHVWTHSGEKPYQCEVCHKSFSYKGSLTKHTRIHSKETPYTCDVCGRGFTIVSDLRRHQLMHDNRKPYKCQLCEYRAFTSCDMHKHVISHSKQYRHQCPTCNKGFLTPSEMRKHVLDKHHTVEE